MEEYIEKCSKFPIAKDLAKPTDEEEKAQKQWCAGNAKARTPIKLAIGDAEIIHIGGAATVQEKKVGTVDDGEGIEGAAWSTGNAMNPIQSDSQREL